MSQAIGASTKRRHSRWRWALYVLAVPVGLAAIYALAAFVFARIPLNPDFLSAPGGVPVIVIDNGIHVDFVLPIAADNHDWREVFDPAATRMGAGLGEVATHIVIGWGHRDFYVNTPTWSDLTASTVARAVLGIGGTVMHITYTNAWFYPENSVMFSLSPSDYRRLVDGIVETTILDESGRAVPLHVSGYVDFDAFYEAEGSYNALHTCNNWAISILDGAGVRVPVWSPLSGAIIDQIRTATAN
jgi:uncharacterized protein (TIGR02117 family)